MENYTIEKTLGKGAFGETFKATSKEDGNVFAIKKIKPRTLLTSEDTFKFNKEMEHELEALYLLMLICYDVSACYRDSFVHDKNFYIVMDFIDGWSVADGCFGSKKLPIKTRQKNYKSIILDLVNGIQKLHTVGIVHQDIKSENIMFDVDSKRFKFIDFGLSCILDQGVVTSSERAYSTFFKNSPCAVPGNMLCLAPEMIDINTSYPRQGETYPETWIKAHDIWSIGCVLFTWFIFPDNTQYEAIEEDLYFGYQFTKKPEKYRGIFEQMKTKIPDLYLVLMIAFQRDPYVRTRLFNRIVVENNTLSIKDADTIQPTWDKPEVTEQAIKNQRAWKESIKKEDTDAYEENIKYQEEEIEKIRKVSFNVPEPLPIQGGDFSDLLSNRDFDDLFAEYK
jgi:serine/threonine protein kinase